MTRVIMDVDTGIDDALALALAVRHPAIDLEAVLTVAGNVDLQRTTSNTLRVLDWLGAEEVPVAVGADRPLVGTFTDASLWHGEDGLGGAELPASCRRPMDDGIGYLVRRLTSEPGAFTLVCTAPLTNLALAIRQEPRLAECVDRLVLMGGAARPPGNVTPVAEFNMFADAEAAAIVFDQPWPITMVGLDVTQRVMLTRAERDALLDASSLEARLVCEVTRFIFDVRGLDRLLLHDALAVAVIVDPSIVSTVDRLVKVETRGDHTRGQTVVDFRSEVQGGYQSGTVQVCLEVDVARFKSLFFETLRLDV